MSATGVELFDITIIGGGPAGLFAAFYAGMRRMRTKIIDSLDKLGGQLVALYPEKFIYDAPGYPAVLARTLAHELIRQAIQYDPTIVLGEKMQRLVRAGEGEWHVETDAAVHRTRTVLIAIGGGAFTPKRLPVIGADRFEGRGLYYFVDDLQQFRNQHILVIGGGDSAVDWALNLLRVTHRVTLVHRRDQFRAHEDSVEKLRASPVQVYAFHELRAVDGRDRLETATIFDNRSGQETTLAVDAVLVNIGFTSSYGALRDWGLQLDAGGIVVNSRMETNLPGVFAAGDITAYPGKLKLIATGFGEAAIAVNHAKALIDPGSSVFPGHSTTIVPKQRNAARGRGEV